MAEPQQYTDAQLSDGTTLRFLGQLEPDEVRQKVQIYRQKQQISASPPSIQKPRLDMQYSLLGNRPDQFPGGKPTSNVIPANAEGGLSGGDQDYGNAMTGAGVGVGAGLGAAATAPWTLPFLAKAGKAALPLLKGGAKVGVAYAGTQAAIEGAKKIIPEIGKIPGIDYLPFLVSSMAGHGQAEPTPGKNPVPPVRWGEAPAEPAPQKVPQVPMRWNPAAEAEPAPRRGNLPIRWNPTPEIEPEPLQRPIAAEPVVPKQTANQLDTLLKNATGAPPPIKPGVPMRQQSESDIAFGKHYPNETMKTPSPDVESTWQKSAGFDQTPAEDVGTKVRAAQPSIPRGAQGQGQSSVVKSFHYDPEAQQMHVTTQNGATYTHGEVTPEQAVEFQKAPNGQAWNKLRQNSTPVANQYGGGKNINVKPPMKFRSYDPNNLENILKQSVKQVKEGK